MTTLTYLDLAPSGSIGCALWERLVKAPAGALAMLRGRVGA